jgi:uncharacterized protein YndB with AHSA1/START domain
MSVTTLKKSIFIKASRETVWSFIAEADKLAEWFHPAVANLEEGQPYALLGDATDPESKMCWGEVLKLDKPSSLVYTFSLKPMGDAVTTVSWTLEEAAGGTRLTLVHEGMGEATQDAGFGFLFAIDAGWDKHFEKLRTVAAA